MMGSRKCAKKSQGTLTVEDLAFRMYKIVILHDLYPKKFADPSEIETPLWDRIEDSLALFDFLLAESRLDRHF